MEEGLVSVIMPSWNTCDYITEAIDSVLGQTYEKLELIIVDDCSDDNTDEIISSYKDSRIRYYKNADNSGAAITRNKAIALAKGEWIAFLDSDDMWSRDKLKHQLEFMNDNGYFFSYHEYEKIDEKSKPLNILVTGPKIVTRKKMYKYGYPGCLTFMYSAKQMGLIQIKDIKKNNDYALLLVLCKKSNCYLLKENLASYRIRGKSISHDRFTKKVKSHYDLFHYCDGNNVITSICYAVRNMIYGLYKKIYYERKIK